MDLSKFFEAIESEFPVIEFAGHKFRVRQTAPDDRQLAITYCKEDSQVILQTMSQETIEAPFDKEQLDRWVKFKSDGNEGISRHFDMDKIKTQGDLERCMFTLTYLEGYLHAMCLSHGDGSNIARKDLFPLAKTIETQPKFKAMILNALQKFDPESGEIPKNAETPSVTE